LPKRFLPKPFLPKLLLPKLLLPRLVRPLFRRLLVTVLVDFAVLARPDFAGFTDGSFDVSVVVVPGRARVRDGREFLGRICERFMDGSSATPAAP
jgi:hypothetical protein